MKTALYCRVSSDAQFEKGYSIGSQTDKLEAYCAARDITEYELYVDGGYTGSSLERPSIQKLIADIKLKIVDAVIVVKLDRLSRKTKDTLFLVEDVFLRNDVTFVSLSESIDTSTPSGKFFITILSSIAQLERENIKERTMAGMKKKASLGLKSGTPKTLVGYDYDRLTKTYSINDYEALQIREIFARYLQGDSVSSIYLYLRDTHTTKYGQWKTLRSVQNILDNETYTGKFMYQKQYVEGVNIPQIISAETFEQVRAIRQYNREHYYRHTSGYLLTGLVWCGECGSRLRGFPKAAYNRWYYICYRRAAHKAVTVHRERSCTLKYINCELLDRCVLSDVKRIAEDITFFKTAKKAEIFTVAADAEILKKEIAKASEKANKLVDLLLEEQIDRAVFGKRLDEINQQKAALVSQLSAVTKRAVAPVATADYNEIKAAAQSIETADLQEKRRVLALLIEKITVFADKSVKITWAF